MPRRIALVSLAAVLGLAGVTAGRDSGRKDKEPQLDFRIIPVPEWVFSTADPSNKSGLRKLKPGIRPVPGAVEEQYDVTEFLRPYGVSFPPGSLAVYTGMLIVRNTTPNLDLISRIFPDKHSEINTGACSIDISAYECTPAPAKNLLPWERLTFNDLQNLPRGSVKLIDRISLAGIFGTRTVTSHVTNPGLPDDTGADAGQNRGGDFTFQRGDTGAELDVVMFSEGVTLRYLMRAKLEGSGREISKVNLSTVFSLWEDYPAVIHVAPVDAQPGKYIVVVAQMDIAGLSRWKLPPPKSAPQPASAARQPAPPNNAIPPGMVLEIFRVPPVFLNPSAQGTPLSDPTGVTPPPVPAETPKHMDAMEFLKNNGVEFPPGSMAAYDKQTSDVIAINTPQNMELIDMIVSSGLGKEGDMLVSVELSAYEFAFPAERIIHNVDKFTFSDLEDLPRDLVKPLGYISLVTRSGEQSVAMKTAGAIADDEPHYKTLQDIWKFEPGETGMKMEVRPLLDTQQRSIDLELKCTLRTAAEKRGGDPMQVMFSGDAKAASGTPFIIHIEPSKDHGGKYIAIVARAKWVNCGGWELPGAK